MADRKIFANQGPTKPDVPKSTFDLSHANNGTYRFGRIYPIFCYQSPAASSFRIKPYAGFDMQPLAFPIQTNVRCHMSFYKIPMRILWKHYRDFVGQHAADGSVADASSQYRIPYISRNGNWHPTGSLADYMGLPSEVMTKELTFKQFQRTRYYSLKYASAPHSFAIVKGDDGVLVMDDVHDAVGTSGHYVGFAIPHVRSYASTSDTKIYVDLLHENSLSVPSTIKVTAYHYKSQPANAKGIFNHGSRYNSATATKSCSVAKVLSSGSPITRQLSNGLNVTRISITLDSEIRAYLTSATNEDSALFLYWPNNSTNEVFGTAVNDPFDNMHVSSQVISSFEKSGDEGYHNLIENLAQGFYPDFSIQVNLTTTSTSTMFQSIPGTNDGKPYIPISALPFRAYEFIYNYFFRNERVTPFEKNHVPTFNEFLTNDGDGADASTPIDFFNAPYEYDLYTTCVKTPQFGNAPLVGITTNDDSATLHMAKLSVTGDYAGNYDINVDTHDHKIVQITNYEDVADNPAVVRLQEAIQYGISINDFRNVNALQRFQERYLKAGTKYQNIVYEFFGTNPPIGEEFPEYIGGVTTNINVSKVVSTADTGDKGLGGYVGQGSFATKGGSIRCFCAEESYIMGVMYFTVTPTYSQMLPRHFSKTQLLDFYNPQFANIGLQPVYRHQIAPLQLSSSEVGEVFGYNRPFSEYVSMQDEVHGNFRTDMANYLLQRVFGSKPQLSEDFLYIKSEDLTDVFCDTDDNDKIFGQIYFDIKAKLPIPRFAVPRII